MSKTIPLDCETILIGEEFNVCLKEDPETRTLELSILMKRGEELEHQHISSKLDLRSDKKFATYKLRAIGKADPVEQAEGGEICIDDEESYYDPQAEHDWLDRKLFKLNHGV